MFFSSSNKKDVIKHKVISFLSVLHTLQGVALVFLSIWINVTLAQFEWTWISFTLVYTGAAACVVNLFNMTLFRPSAKIARINCYIICYTLLILSYASTIVCSVVFYMNYLHNESVTFRCFIPTFVSLVFTNTCFVVVAICLIISYRHQQASKSSNMVVVMIMNVGVAIIGLALVVISVISHLHSFGYASTDFFIDLVQYITMLMT